MKCPNPECKNEQYEPDDVCMWCGHSSQSVSKAEIISPYREELGVGMVYEPKKIETPEFEEIRREILFMIWGV